MNDENLTLPGEGSVSNGGNGGDESASLDPHFPWTDFYEAIADGLLAYRDSRRKLLDKVRELEDKLEEKEEGNILKNLDDICPLSVMARFNRGGLGDPKRIKFAEGLASFLCISEPVPQKFGHVGIPTVQNMGERVLFFDLEKRKADDIDSLWELFACALALAKSHRVEETRKAFKCSYNKALEVEKVYVPKLTKGLYWIRPWFFLPLDKYSRWRIEKKLGMSIPRDSPKDWPKGESYLDLRDKVEARFKDENPYRSFPELALWTKEDSIPEV